MLKKLLIAVFVLGLILTFSIAESSDILLKNDAPRVKVIQPQSNDLQRGLMPGYIVPSHERVNLSGREKVEGDAAPAYLPLSDFAKSGCDYQRWITYTYWIWDAYGYEVSMRFTPTPNTKTMLNGSRVLVKEFGGSGTGGFDFYIRVWDDATGLPGSMIYEEIYTWDYFDANIENGDWHTFEFAESIDVSGDDYHISISYVPTGDESGYLVWQSDDCYSGVADRDAAYDGGVWYDGSVFWLFDFCPGGTGGGYNWTIDAFYCEIGTFDGVCESLSPFTAGNNIFSAPMPYDDAAWGVTDGSMFMGVGQKFNSVTPQVLSAIDLRHWSSGQYVGTNESNYFIVEIWDDLSGSIDVVSGPIATRNSPSGIADLYDGADDGGYRYIWVDFESDNIVLPSAYHVTVRAASSNPADGQMSIVGATDGIAGSVLYDPTEGWRLAQDSPNWGTAWGATYATGLNWYLRPVVCVDEFFVCDAPNLSNLANEDWWFVGGELITGTAQHVKAQLLNRVEKVSFYIDEPTWAGKIEPVNTITTLYIWKDNNGEPGQVAWSKDVAWGDLVVWPGWHEEVIEEYVEGNFWIGYKVKNPMDHPDEFIMAITDAVGPHVDLGGRFYYLPNDAWYSLSAWGAPLANMHARVEYCAIPLPEIICEPLSDDGWATAQGDMARTGSSMLSVGDVKCELTLNWSDTHASGAINLAAPVIFGDKVIQTFDTEIKVYNIADGSVAYILDAASGDGSLLASSGLGCTPAVISMMINHDADDGTTPDEMTDVMFIGGAGTNGVGAVRLSDGFVIWQSTSASGWMGPAALGSIVSTSFVVFEHPTAGTSIAYGTLMYAVIARDAATGGYLWHHSLTASPNISGTSDGTDLYYCTYNVGVEGDVIKLSGADGSEIWTLSGRGGKVGATPSYYGEDQTGPEGFRGGIAYDEIEGMLYVISSCYMIGGANGTDGIFYKIDASDGYHGASPVKSNRGDYNTPILDKIRVYAPTYSAWVGGTAGGALLAFNSTTLGVAFSMQPPGGARYIMSGFRTCEPDGEDDLIFIMNELGFLDVWNSVKGEMLFSRRISHNTSNKGGSGAIAEVDGTVHMVFSDLGGGIYDLTNDPNRNFGRFELLTYNIKAPAEFGDLLSLEVNFGELVINNGCSNVKILDVGLNDGPSGVYIPNYTASDLSNERAESSANIASSLTKESRKLFKRIDFTEDNFSKKTDFVYNRASAQPEWVNGIISPFVDQIIFPDQIVNLIIDVKQSVVSRGVQSVWINFATTDTDYFLNDDGSPLAEISVNLIGGCLPSKQLVYFGVGNLNSAWVTNTTTLGSLNWNPYWIDYQDPANLIGQSWYSGSYFMGVSDHRVAAAYEEYNWGHWYYSILGDPNLCGDEESCLPFLDIDAEVGKISSDFGATYQQLIANKVCKIWIDSVQNFTLPGGTWSFRYGDNPEAAPYDNDLTMGIMCDHTNYTIHKNPLFSNLFIDKFEMVNRNSEPLTDWFFSFHADNDLEYVYDFTLYRENNAAMNEAASAAWLYLTPEAGAPPIEAAQGIIKIPFGCGTLGEDDDWDLNPVINIHPLGGDEKYIGRIMDSIYSWSSVGTGVQPQTYGDGLEDASSWVTIAAHDFAGNGQPGGSYSFASVVFSITDLSSGATGGTEIPALADLVNKWAGFGRGDVNNDGAINLIDIMYLIIYVDDPVNNPGAYPFAHLGDVNASGGLPNIDDVNYLIDFYWDCGPCPMGAWEI